MWIALVNDYPYKSKEENISSNQALMRACVSKYSPCQNLKLGMTCKQVSRLNDNGGMCIFQVLQRPAALITSPITGFLQHPTSGQWTDVHAKIGREYDKKKLTSPVHRILLYNSEPLFICCDSNQEVCLSECNKMFQKRRHINFLLFYMDK